jgi:large subunit ribosomal protein L2
MILIKYKPVTNGIRHQVNIKKSLLSKTNCLFKQAIVGLKQSGGRSSSNGRTTVWHKGRACKSNFRKIKFTSESFNSIVVCVMYDPNRNAFVSLNFDLDKFSFFLTLATNFIYSGSLISCTSQKTEFSLGNRTLIDNIPAGSIVHSLTSSSNKNKTIFSRSAGTYCQLIQKGLKECKVRLPSGSIITTPFDSYATLGVISNVNQKFTVLGKAGRNRLKGIRPTTRGVAMNPVDHPHGGRTNGGRPSVTPWGISTKGKPTVKNKK